MLYTTCVFVTWKVNNDRWKHGYILGVSAKKHFEREDRSWFDETFYGVRTDLRSWYLRGTKSEENNGSSSEVSDTHRHNLDNFTNWKECEIDILMDVDKGILKIQTVASLTNGELCIKGLNDSHKPNTDGWIPHLATSGAKQSFQICRIEPSTLYGKDLDINWN